MNDPITIRAGFSPPARVTDVVFDWDGTLSYIRAGWGEVMQALFLTHLPAVAGEDLESRRRLAHDDIWRLNGKPTIHQMQCLAERVTDRGGRALSPGDYLDLYARALGRVVGARLDDVRSGLATADDFMPPGTRTLLQSLLQQGVRLHVASGTEQHHVIAEAEALGVAPWFEGRIHGPLTADDRNYSKRGIMEAVLDQQRILPAQLAVFGDGQVEIEQARSLGATAIAVATDEEIFGSGRIDPFKQARLSAVGADAVIPDYRNLPGLLALLGITP